MFPKQQCDECQEWTTYARVAAHAPDSDETLVVCAQCDDIAQWRRAPYIQGILGRVDASAAAWLKRAPFVHRYPPMPPAAVIQEWLADIVVWCAAHDVDLNDIWPRSVNEANEDQRHAQEEYDDKA
jgi:hypothetical protein